MAKKEMEVVRKSSRTERMFGNAPQLFLANERYRKASCDGKIQHPTPGSVHTYVAKHHPRDVPHLHVYRCTFCGSWHAGWKRQ